MRLFFLLEDKNPFLLIPIFNQNISRQINIYWNTHHSFFFQLCSRIQTGNTIKLIGSVIWQEVTRSEKKSSTILKNISIFDTSQLN